MDWLLFHMEIIWLQDYITAKLLTLVANRIQLLAVVSFLFTDLFTVGEASGWLLLKTEWGVFSLVYIFVECFHFRSSDIVSSCRLIQFRPQNLIFKADNCENIFYREIVFNFHTSIKTYKQTKKSRWNNFTFTSIYLYRHMLDLPWDRQKCSQGRWGENGGKQPCILGMV